jgi:Holliday junction resolvasome RuvABC ATP-dependent DNA helicase subunit
MYESMSYLGRDKITLDIVQARFSLMGIDPIGLTKSDIIILKHLYYSEAPTGLDSLAVKTNLDPKTIAEVNEPYLILRGLMERSKGGRIITSLGEEHLLTYGHIKPRKKTVPTGPSRILRQIEQGD